MPAARSAKGHPIRAEEPAVRCRQALGQAGIPPFSQNPAPSASSRDRSISLTAISEPLPRSVCAFHLGFGLGRAWRPAVPAPDGRPERRGRSGRLPPGGGPGAHRAWVLPVPGSPKASTLTPRSTKLPWADDPVAAAAPRASDRARRACPREDGGFPGLARGQPGFSAQPVDASVAAILSFLLQDFQESCQGIAVSSGGETGYRLGAHRGQLELAAQLADAVLHPAGVRHAHTTAAARLTVSRRS